MIKFMSKLKARYVFLMFFIMIIIDVLLVILTMKLNNKTASFIILLISFLITGSLLNTAVFKVFNDRARKYNTVIRKFKGIEYLESNLSDFTINKKKYGTVYSKVIDKCAYKVTIVDDYLAYAEENKEDENYNKTPGIDDAKWMIGLEIFKSYNDDLLNKLEFYSMSGEKLYYEGLYIEDDNIISKDHVEPYTYLCDKYKYICLRVGIYDEENNNI